jgi:hypothetical protein
MRHTPILVPLFLVAGGLSLGQEVVNFNELELSPNHYKQVVVGDVSMKCVLERQYDHATFAGVAGPPNPVVKPLKDVVSDHDGVAFVLSDGLADRLNAIFSKRPPTADYPCMVQMGGIRRAGQLAKVKLTCNVRQISLDGQRVWVADVVKFEFANGLVVP